MKFKEWLKTEIDEDLPSILKGLKEAGRVVVISIIPMLVIQLTNDQFNWKAIWLVGAITLLKFTDKVLHEVGKETGNESLELGLTRF